MSMLSSIRRLRLALGVVLAAAVLTLLISRSLEDADLQAAVASAFAADDRLIEAALEQYPRQAPAIVATYGGLELFREQLARFGPQVVPIVAAYQNAFTTADAVRIAHEAWQASLDQLATITTLVWPPGEGAGIADLAEEPMESAPVELGRLTPEDRGLIALLHMRDRGNAFVGQWDITATGEARLVPSRVVVLGGTELLIPGLTALERGLVQEREIDWQTYGLAAVDAAAIASGVTLLRLAKPAGRALRDAARTPAFRPSALATKVMGIKAARFGLPIGLVALMVLHPGVFTHYLWSLAESLGLPGIVGPLVGWGIVVVPLAFLVSWLLLSVRALRLAGRLCAGAARGCQRLARLAAPARR